MNEMNTARIDDIAAAPSPGPALPDDTQPAGGTAAGRSRKAK